MGRLRRQIWVAAGISFGAAVLAHVQRPGAAAGAPPAAATAATRPAPTTRPAIEPAAAGPSPNASPLLSPSAEAAEPGQAGPRFEAFAARLLPLLTREVEARPLDLWTQRYDAAPAAIRSTATGNATYPLSGFLTLGKRWRSTQRFGGTYYESTAATTDTLAFFLRDGRWEFASGRSRGEMTLSLPGSPQPLVNPIDSDLGDDARIRRAVQLANAAGEPAGPKLARQP